MIVHLVYEVMPKKVLDIGCGYGKYGLLLREYVGNFEKLDAVEIEKSYITDIQRAIYDTLYQCDVLDLNPEIFEGYDLCLMIDVIEHLEKKSGKDLIERIPSYIVIATPLDFFENPKNLPNSEKHLSLWTLEDFGERVERDESMLGGLIVRLKPKCR